MLVIDAIPFSFSILWRFVVTFPILVIGLVLYGLVGGLIGALFGFLFPGTNVLIVFLVSASSSVIPVLVGARFGFQSRHIRPSSGYKKLILPALMYGALETLITALALLPILGTAMLLFTPDALDFATAQGSEISQILETSGPLLALALVPLIAICGIRACLLVPMASASIGRDPNNHSYTPFRNFGASFWPLFALVVLSYLGMAIIYAVSFVVLLALAATGILDGQIQDLQAMIDGTAPFRPNWAMIVIAAVYIVIALWSFSLQCAGGVLGYLKLSGGSAPITGAEVSDPQPVPPPTTNSGPRMTAEELRALRKSRQT